MPQLSYDEVNLMLRLYDIAKQGPGSLSIFTRYHPKK
jgi:hypothetical protein